MGETQHGTGHPTVPPPDAVPETLAELGAAREQIRQILETANDAFVAIDEDGVIREWNRAAEATFGWSAQEAFGRSLAETLVPTGYRQSHLDGLQRFLDTGEQRVLFERLELSALHRDGHEFPVELTIWPTRGPGGCWRFNAFLRDVTERRQLEAHARVLHSITATANAATTAEEAVRAAAREIMQLTGWDICHVYVPDGRGHLVSSGWWEGIDGSFDAFRELTEHTPIDVGDVLPGRVAATRQPEWIVDVTDADVGFRRAAAAAACGVISAQAFPVLVGEGAVAVLEFFSTRVQPPDERMLTLMEDVGLQLGRVFEREEAQAWKTRMVSTVAHELRNPLAVLTGWASLLEDSWREASEEEKLDYLRTVTRQGERLERLVDDLLTLSRLEQRSVATRPCRVPLAVAVRQAVAEFDVAPVEVSIPDDLAAYADADHVLQILGNLLTNAVKYGQRPITVEASSIPPEVRMRVRDRGPGIDDGFVPRLFEEFSRSTRSSEDSGTGLGLSIVLRLARANGGTAHYEPNEPQGACFVVTLPAADPETPGGAGPTCPT